MAQDLRAELDEARAALEAEHAGLSAEEVAALVIAGLEDRLPPPRAKAGSRR